MHQLRCLHKLWDRLCPCKHESGSSYYSIKHRKGNAGISLQLLYWKLAQRLLYKTNSASSTSKSQLNYDKITTNSVIRRQRYGRICIANFARLYVDESK